MPKETTFSGVAISSHEANSVTFSACCATVGQPTGLSSRVNLDNRLASRLLNAEATSRSSMYYVLTRCSRSWILPALLITWRSVPRTCLQARSNVDVADLLSQGLSSSAPHRLAFHCHISGSARLRSTEVGKLSDKRREQENQRGGMKF